MEKSMPEIYYFFFINLLMYFACCQSMIPLLFFRLLIFFFFFIVALDVPFHHRSLSENCVFISIYCWPPYVYEISIYMNNAPYVLLAVYGFKWYMYIFSTLPYATEWFWQFSFNCDLCSTLFQFLEMMSKWF